MKQLLTCILNDKAGTRSGGDVRALIAQRAAERGWEARFQEIPENGDLRTTAEEACGAGGIVVAGGGDGTISAVASALVDTDVVLGVLPMGTLNHFAKDMGIPLDLEKALETLFTGVTRRVDIGEVNGRVFLNNSSIGFYPRVVKERERDQRRGYGKWVAFVRAVTRIARQPRTLRLEMGKDDGQRQSYETPFVFIGNNRYSVSGFEIGTRAALDGGTLWVCSAPYASRRKLVWLALRALLGSLREMDLAAFETTEARLHPTRAEILVATDGEVSMMRTPLHYRSRASALHVRVPRPD